MGEISIQPGESEKIISQPPTGSAWNIEVGGADVFLSHNSSGIIRQGKRVQEGDRATVDNLQGQPLFAKSPPANATEATITVNKAAFNLTYEPRVSLQSTQANREGVGIQEFSLSAANSDESPSPLEVPDGFDVSIVTQSGNTGTVYLKDPTTGDTIPVPGSGSLSLGVTDHADLTFRAPNAGDGVILMSEA